MKNCGNNQYARFNGSDPTHFSQNTNANRNDKTKQLSAVLQEDRPK